MKRKIGAPRRRGLIQDLLSAQHDLTAIAQRHKLDEDDLSRWILDAKNYRCLTGLCLLADVQTQLLLSRFRATAASRLIKLANESEDGDLARKACVDLLRLDLKRVTPAMPQEEGEEEEVSLREVLYGEEGEGEPADE